MLCVAIWPNLACRNRFCRFTSGTHFAQYTEPVVTADPHRGQRAFVWGIRGVLATRLPALAALRRACVNLVGGKLNFDLFSLPCQKIRAASSATGATALRHVIAVH